MFLPISTISGTSGSNYDPALLVLALDQARLPEVAMTTPVLNGGASPSGGCKVLSPETARGVTVKRESGSVNSVMMENSMKKAQSSGSKVVDQQEVPTSECHRTTYDVAEVDQASTLAQGVATKGGSDVGSIGESRVEGESCEKK
ncbi:hypothetical protein K435DRAFT_840955 [Dendrothele bispora CBS 962.96]|uniref:Uncharacterized protein n=1 Tax=Dendrothele bispora (strain CBS 962.96) TaxID=1314807 RepID=A0A4S8LQ93_DENBC|nr:hypothetical protein K435DRAFT_840955 [Dendrothele bispora CBS 962.96]